ANHPPAAANQETSALWNSTADLPHSVAGNVRGSATDADGDVVAVSAAGEPGHGSLSMNAAGDFVYVPERGFVGDDTFTFTLTDGIAQATGTVTIHVIDQAPVAAPDYYQAWQGSLLRVDPEGVLANDSDPDDDNLTAVLVDPPDFAEPGSFHL